MVPIRRCRARSRPPRRPGTPDPAIRDPATPPDPPSPAQGWYAVRVAAGVRLAGEAVRRVPAETRRLHGERPARTQAGRPCRRGRPAPGHRRPDGPRHPRGSPRRADRHAQRDRLPGRWTRAEAEARRALRLRGLLHARLAQGRLRGGDPHQSAHGSGHLPRRRAGDPRAERVAGARRTWTAGRMARGHGALRPGGALRPAGGARQPRAGPDGPARPGDRGAAHGGRGSQRPRRPRGDGVGDRRQRHGLRAAGKGGAGSRQGGGADHRGAGRARHRGTPARAAAQGRLRAPVPRRPAPAQHRADRRPAHAVRRHRVQRRDRVRGRRLRPGVPADGSLAARPAGSRQRRVERLAPGHPRRGEPGAAAAVPVLPCRRARGGGSCAPWPGAT